MRKIDTTLDVKSDFWLATHTLPFFPRMSKSSLSSLQTQVTELQTQSAAFKSQIEALLARFPAAVVVPEVKTKKSRKPKDPDAPKKALSGYLLFCQAERAKTPELKIKLDELATRWRALTAEERLSFKSVPAAPVPVAKTTFQEVRDIAATMSSTLAGKFMRFCAQNHTLDAETLVARWKELSPEEKAKFNDAGDDTDDNESSDDSSTDSSDDE